MELELALSKPIIQIIRIKASLVLHLKVSHSMRFITYLMVVLFILMNQKNSIILKKDIAFKRSKVKGVEFYNQKKILYRTILEIECSMFNEYEIY